MNLGQAGERDAARVRRTVEEVYAAEDFSLPGQEEPGWFAELWDDFTEWLDERLGIPPGVLSTGLNWIFWALIVALALWLAYLIVRQVRLARARASDDGGAAGTREARVAGFLRAAAEARARGELAQALRFYFWALVIGLAERGDLEYRDAWTNRELVERGRPRPEVERLLAPLVPALDARSFGHVPATEGDVAELAELCRTHLRQVAT